MILTLLLGLAIGVVVVIVMTAMARARNNRDLSVGAPPAQVIAAPPRPIAAPAQSGDLEQLWSLHQKGALTAEEYAAAKARVLEGGPTLASDGLYQAVLTHCGEQKIAVIKEVRELTGLGLKEAKDAVEGPPFVLGQGLTSEQAARIQGDFAAVGAQVELR